MPELPEVETTLRALEHRLAGRMIKAVAQNRADLRFPLPDGLPERLQGRRMTAFSRRAKYMQIGLDDGNCLLIHLGMSGRLVFDGEEGRDHEHLTFDFEDGTRLRYIDPRRFGMIDLTASAQVSEHRWLAHLGLEPLSNSFHGPSLLNALNGRLSAVKTVIMDQKVVVGVGNIYASESLFRSRISPKRLACNIGPQRAERLAIAIQAVLRDAIDAGGSSLRDYVQSNGELGNFQSFFNVYDRAGEPCVRCKRLVKRIVQTGRATFFCAGCQR